MGPSVAMPSSEAGAGSADAPLHCPSVDIDGTKSPRDEKCYRVVVLENGLRALLISDEKSGGRKAACALSVGVGFLSDPAELEGTAHFLEHMISMGSEKFPGTNDFASFMASHGGYENAHTDAETTVFSFEVDSPFLSGALERFAACFACPLLTGEAWKKEVRAIESEFQQVVQSDSTRLSTLIAGSLHLRGSDEPHPLATFGWGNHKSLVDIPESKGLDANARLDTMRAFYRKYYGACSMRLVVYGQAALDDLESMITAAGFADIARGSERPTFAPFSPPALCTVSDDNSSVLFHKIAAVKSTNQLVMTWALDPHFANYRVKTTEIVSHILGHEGEGSLLSALKLEGLATDITAGVDGSDGFETSSASTIYQISVSLTEMGIAASNWHTVVRMIFRYLSIIKESGSLRWVFDEMGTIAKMQYDNRDFPAPYDYTETLAGRWQWWGMRDVEVLQATYMFHDWQPGTVSDLLDELMSPKSCRYDLLSSAFKAKGADSSGLEAEDSDEEFEEDNEDDEEFEDDDDDESMESDDDSDAGDTFNYVDEEFSRRLDEHKSETWFGTQYLRCDVPASAVEAWKRAASGADTLQDIASGAALCMIKPNAYVAENFEIKPFENESAENDKTNIPQDILMASKASHPLHKNLWYCRDATFKTPCGFVAHKIYLGTSSSLREDCVSYHQLKPRAAAILTLFVKYLSDSLNEEMYTAEMAELHFSASTLDGVRGIELQFCGFHDKLHLLADRVLSELVPKVEMSASDVQLVKFANVKEERLRSLRNSLLRPDKHAQYLRVRKLCQQHGHHPDVMLKQTEDLSLADVVGGVRQLFAEGVCVETLVHGNFSKDDACYFASKIEHVFPAECALSAPSLPVAIAVPVLSANDPSARIAVDGKNANDPNNALEVYYQIGEKTILNTCFVDIVETLMEEPCFDELRTKKGLGYDVSCGTRLTRGCVGYVLRLSTSKHTADHAESCVSEFVTSSFLSLLKRFDEEKFRSSVRGLISELLEPDHALGDISTRIWCEIRPEYYDFKSKEMEAQALEQMLATSSRGGLDDVIAFYEKYFISEPRVLTVRVHSNKKKD